MGTTLRAALAEVLPTADSAANLNSADVIGNKTDSSNGDSLYAITRLVEARLNNASKCYPTLANGVTVVGHATAWTLGDAIEVIPASTITEKFLIYWAKIEAVSAADVYEVVLYSGAAADTEIARFRTARDDVYPQAGDISISTEIQPANTKISAKCASKTGGGDTITISLHYVEIAV